MVARKHGSICFPSDSAARRTPWERQQELCAREQQLTAVKGGTHLYGVADAWRGATARTGSTWRRGGGAAGGAVERRRRGEREREAAFFCALQLPLPPHKMPAPQPSAPLNRTRYHGLLLLHSFDPCSTRLTPAPLVCPATAPPPKPCSPQDQHGACVRARPPLCPATPLPRRASATPRAAFGCRVQPSLSAVAFGRRIFWRIFRLGGLSCVHERSPLGPRRAGRVDRVAWRRPGRLPLSRCASGERRAIGDVFSPKTPGVKTHTFRFAAADAPCRAEHAASCCHTPLGRARREVTGSERRRRRSATPLPDPNPPFGDM